MRPFRRIEARLFLRGKLGKNGSMRQWLVSFLPLVTWTWLVPLACSSPYDSSSTEVPEGGTPSPPPEVRTDGGPSTPPADAAIDAAFAGPSWKLYANSAVTPNAWTSIDLGVAWAGPNAPPPRGIMAVTQLTVSDRLLVWADDGYFYTRADGKWQPRQATDTAFPALKGRDFRGVYHQPNYPTTGVEELTFVDNPTAIQFTYSLEGAINLEGPPLTMADEPPPFGAPKASKKCRWVTRQWKLGQVGPELLTEYSGYDGDPYVYYYDGTPMPAGKWLFADAPLFKDKTGVPLRERIMSGWRDDKLEITYLVVE